MPAITTVTIYRGTAMTLRYTVKNDAGAIVNVSGWTTSFTVRVTPKTADPLALGPLAGAVVGDGSAGQIDVAMTATQTLSVAAQAYACSLTRTDSGAEDVLAIGVMTVKNDILHAAIA